MSYQESSDDESYEDQEQQFFQDNNIKKEDLISFHSIGIITKDCCNHYIHKFTGCIYSEQGGRYGTSKWVILPENYRESLRKTYIANKKN